MKYQYLPEETNDFIFFFLSDKNPVLSVVLPILILLAAIGFIMFCLIRKNKKR